MRADFEEMLKLDRRKRDRPKATVNLESQFHHSFAIHFLTQGGFLTRPLMDHFSTDRDLPSESDPVRT